MKKAWITMIIICVLTSLLCGCGGKPQEAQSTEEEKEEVDGSRTEEESTKLPEGYVLSASFQAAGEEAEMRKTFLVGTSLYYDISSYDQKKEMLVQDIYVQEEGSEAQLWLHFGDESGKRLMAWTAGEDGSLYYLQGEFTGEEIKSYTLEKRDQELQEVYSVDMTESIEDISSLYEMAAGPDGSLYGVTIGGILTVTAVSGREELIFSVSLGIMKRRHSFC